MHAYLCIKTLEPVNEKQTVIVAQAEVTHWILCDCYSDFLNINSQEH